MSPAIAGRISYPGGLTTDRSRLHTQMKMGYEGKFQAAYDTPFWRSEGWTGQVIGNGSPLDVTFETYSQGKYWLMGFISGENMLDLDNDSEASLIERCTQSFVDYFGPQARTGMVDKGYKRWDLDAVLVGRPDRHRGPQRDHPRRYGAAPADRADPLGRHRERHLLAGLHGRCRDLRLPHRRRGQRRPRLTPPRTRRVAVTSRGRGYGHRHADVQGGTSARRPANPPRWPDPVALVDWAQGAKTALAGVLAWVVATDVLGLEQPFLAPWAAVLVVHATVYRTVSRGGQQVVATFLGVFIAWAAGAVFGVGPLGHGRDARSPPFLVGRLRWLGEESTTIATTGIVVLATNAIDESNLLAGRLLDTTRRASSSGWRSTCSCGRRCATGPRGRTPTSCRTSSPGVLSEMAAGLGPGPRLLRRRGVVPALPRARRPHRRGAGGCCARPRRAAGSTRAAAVPPTSRPSRLPLHLLEQSVAETLSLARTIATSADHANVWEDSFRSEWKRLLADHRERARRR